MLGNVILRYLLILKLKLILLLKYFRWILALQFRKIHLLKADKYKQENYDFWQMPLFFITQFTLCLSRHGGGLKM